MLGLPRAATAEEVIIMNNRNLIIGAIVVAVVLVAGYFLMTAYEATPPAPTPTAQTEPKK
jgi:hypothetical protein